MRADTRGLSRGYFCLVAEMKVLCVLLSAITSIISRKSYVVDILLLGSPEAG